ncbi:uncharacterized protein LOC120016491 [Tripterygium wilfordii]|uniref:uncharacterized protein LOC120016491 n=1 Tax=Tripterygium wilfordii TaxID=458696 RepID=UPI0018F85E6A|nr:uncharacterized protein LOC120016491 [Tripterygium wilfordii]
MRVVRWCLARFYRGFRDLSSTSESETRKAGDMAASMAGRATPTLLRAAWRTPSTNSVIARATTTKRISVSLPTPSLSSNLMLRQSRISASPSRLVRRELSTFLPVHSAIASACLVSKLPSEFTPSTEGRFANYVSPI